jgi:hypothetical protein
VVEHLLGINKNELEVHPMKLMDMMRLMDLPRHNGAVSYVRAWDFFCIATNSILIFSVALAVLLAATVLEVRVVAENFPDQQLKYFLRQNITIWPMAVVAAVVAVIFSWVEYSKTDVQPQAVYGISGTAYAGAGIAFALLLKQPGLVVGIYGLTGFVFGLIHGVAIYITAFACGLALGLLGLVMYVPSKIFELAFKALFPAWKNIVSLSPTGFSKLTYGNSRLFVLNKDLRRNGYSASLGIPTFTWGEICNGNEVRRRLEEWAGDNEKRKNIESALPGALAATFGVAAVAYMDSPDFAVGLPPMESSLLSLNPATGLQMIDGGAIDIMGNPMGIDLGHAGADLSTPDIV